MCSCFQHAYRRDALFFHLEKSVAKKSSGANIGSVQKEEAAVICFYVVPVMIHLSRPDRAHASMQSDLISFQYMSRDYNSSVSFNMPSRYIFVSFYSVYRQSFEMLLNKCGATRADVEGGQSVPPKCW